MTPKVEGSRSVSFSFVNHWARGQYYPRGRVNDFAGRLSILNATLVALSFRCSFEGWFSTSRRMSPLRLGLWDLSRYATGPDNLVAYPTLP